MNDEKTPENPQTKIVISENAKPAPSYKTEDPLEDHIKTLCEDHGMTIEQIRAGIQGCQYPDRREKFNGVRDRLIKSLASDEVFGQLTQVDIGKILCMAGSGVAARMQKMGISPTNPREKHSRAFKAKKPKATAPANLTNQLILDFSDHQETLEKIREAAKALMREPEAQVLYWLVHSDFEKLEGR